MKTFAKFIMGMVAVGFVGSLFILGIVVSISFDLPQINSLADYNPPIPSQIYSRDGELLYEAGIEKREVASFEEIPPLLVNAFLSAEDDNFFNHTGVDYKGIARAMLKNIKAGRIVQGASTITQQVAKSLLLSSERTFTRKIKDLLLAKKIEEKFTKEEILFLYLNQVYLGGGYYGVKSAFQGYFGKELAKATVAEAALVAGLLVAPGRYSPYVNPEYAKNRQLYVLGRMLATNKISQLEYDEALRENIQMHIRKPSPFKAPYFTDWIRQRLIQKFGEENFLSNGFKVVTTIDWELQKKAEIEIVEGVKEIDKRQGFKGPLRSLELDLVPNELIEQRKKIYDAKSEYFTFYSDGSTQPQYKYEEGEIENVLNFEKSELELVNTRWKPYMEAGTYMDQDFNSLIEIGENYEGIITRVSNSQRMIYVSVAGVKGMIPYEYFRWAHERKITEDRHYWSYQTRPEDILSAGDVVLVKVVGKPRSLWSYLHSTFRTQVKDEESVNFFKKQKFFLMSLDQEADAQGALLAISPQSGEIISMVGGTDFSKSQFNRAVQSNRQPGSAFKPFIYAVGLENGYTPASKLIDSPQALGGVDESLNWKPRNYDGSFKGEMTFRKALETSRNIPTIRLTQDVRVSRIRNFVERLKVNTSLPKDLSVSLGSFGINLLDLVKAYAIFPNGGRLVKLKAVESIQDRNGKNYFLENEEQDPSVNALENINKSEVDNEIALDGGEGLGSPNGNTEDESGANETNPFLVNLDENQVYDQRLAYIMTSILRGTIQNGTGKGVRDLSSFIGGKTGTTNNYVDAWFLGFSANLVTGVWTGFDDNQTLGWGETGARSAMPIWKDYMELGLKKYGEHDFPTPSGIVNVSINPETGRLSNSSDRKKFMESFVEGTEPGVSKILSESEGSELNLSDSLLEDEEYYISQ